MGEKPGECGSLDTKKNSFSRRRKVKSIQVCREATCHETSRGGRGVSLRFRGIEVTGYLDKNSVNRQVGEEASWARLMSKELLNKGKQ